jgi:hypothetical protein
VGGRLARAVGSCAQAGFESVITPIRSSVAGSRRQVRRQVVRFEPQPSQPGVGRRSGRRTSRVDGEVATRDLRGRPPAWLERRFRRVESGLTFWLPVEVER